MFIAHLHNACVKLCKKQIQMQNISRYRYVLISLTYKIIYFE